MTGDTWQFTAWDATGRIFGTYNDGTMPGGANSANIAIVELTSYDPSNVNNTNIALVNPMTSFGAAQSTVGYCAPGWTWKSDDPFAANGNLYLLVSCMQNTSGFVHGPSTLIMSPDHGAHWCNVSHYLAAGNTCTAANWSAAGDVPTSSADMLWTGSSKTDASNPMAQGVFVQVCQNQAVNCPPALTASACDPAVYLCFNGITGTYASMIAARVSGDPMILANWQYWDGASYQSSLAAAVSVATLYHGLGVTPSIVYLPDGALYLMEGDNGATIGQTPSQIRFSVAANAYGPWTVVCTSPTTPQSNFPTAMLSRLTRLGANHYSLTTEVGGSYQNAAIYHPYFTDLDLNQVQAATATCQ